MTRAILKTVAAVGAGSTADTGSNVIGTIAVATGSTTADTVTTATSFNL